MVDVHYFIFILNADSALFAAVTFAMAYIGLRLVYKMWRSSLKCPHCGEIYRSHLPPPVVVDRTLPNSLWT